jgi:hypothetical protein
MNEWDKKGVGGIIFGYEDTQVGYGNRPPLCFGIKG